MLRQPRSIIALVYIKASVSIRRLINDNGKIYLVVSHDIES